MGMFPPTDIEPREVIVIKTAVGNGPCRHVPLTVKCNVLYRRRKNHLIGRVGMNGRIGPKQRRVLKSRTVTHIDRHLDNRRFRIYGVSDQGIHTLQALGIVYPYRHTAVIVLLAT